LNQRSFYGVAAVAVASILVGATFAAYYFAQYSSEKSANAELLQELNGSTSKYTQLASNYNTLLSRYNESVSLLSRSIGVINTSEPVYRQASSELNALWQTYLGLKPASTSLLQNNVLINFGNGTRVWYNNTRGQPGWNFYVETIVLENGNVVAKWYPQFGSHLVTAIGGVSSTQTKFWFVWTFDKAASWQQAPVGADQLMVTDGSTFAWTLCSVDQNFNPTCKP
jgi:hypothetical protein